MKRVVNVILALSCVLAFVFFVFFFAKAQRAALAAALPVAGRAIEMESAQEPAEKTKEVKAAGQRAKILPGWGEIFLDALDLNLDDDEELEQVIIVKPSQEENGKISLVIADFLPSTNGYIRLWKGETLAVKPNALVVQPWDLLNEGMVDLLCFGVDAQNSQTLTVFKRDSAGSSVYYNAFSGSGLSLAVDEPQAAPSDAGQNAATISVFEKAAQGTSPFDQNKVLYAWDPVEKIFVRGSETFLRGENIEQAFINKVITGKAEDFETYLQGLWEKLPAADEKKEGRALPPTLVYFASGERKITIHSEYEQQEWDWGRSTAAFAGVYAPISNSAVPEMLRLLGIDLVGVDKVRIRATSLQVVRFSIREDWNGVYRRVTGSNAVAASAAEAAPQTKEALLVPLEGSDREKSFQPGDFDGFYVSQSGSRLELADRRFIMTSGESVDKGYFSLFRAAGSTLLDLSFVDETSLPAGRLSYIVSVRTGKTGAISGLVLRSARVFSQGAQRTFQPDIVYSKLEN